MPAYLVSIPTTIRATLQNDVNAAVVFAATTGDAIAIAKAAGGMDSNASWDQATVTTIAAPSDLTGFVFRVKQTNTAGVVIKDITYTAGAVAIDAAGTAFATAIGGATYNTTTQVLELAASGSGDHSLEVGVYLPTAQGQDAPIPGFIASLTHRGSAGSSLAFTLAADAFVLPKLHGLLTIRP